jgi:geranylgeranyl reductase family protein
VSNLFYDVVIVGAGPAGLSCAKILAQNNKKVLVLEKNKVVGPKICAGGLTSKDLEHGLPKELATDFKKIIFSSKNINTNITSERLIVSCISRKDLGQWMLKQAKKAGAVVKTSSRVTDISENYLIVNNKKIQFKFLVGADGSQSLVRKHLAIKSNKLMAAIQYIVPQTLKNLEIYLNAELFKTGYAWIFPHKNFSAVGACVEFSSLSSKDLKLNLTKYIKINNVNLSKAKLEAFIINYDYQGYSFGNKFLIGDAAGLASGLTGEGIYFAIVSGEEISKVILDSNYCPEKLLKIIKIKKTHEKLLKIMQLAGPLRNILFNIFALVLKNKLLRKILINKFI